MSSYKSEWEASYQNKDNFVFYPHEEIIRFTSKYIRKRTGLFEFRDVYTNSSKPKILDLGCGIGRHVIYAHQMGLDAYGIDLSDTAIQVAVTWAEKEGISNLDSKVRQGYTQSLPWENDFFDFVISHGVLDSMRFEEATQTMDEVKRVLVKGGLFYCDLISGDDSRHAREFSGEEDVETLHEKGTVQSYFNYGKIEKLIGCNFEILECNLIRRENVNTGGYSSRYHLILRNMK
ncbi:class I SAM-dependent methyltransferase [Brevibacillus sp. FSL K6-0770]|jgi:SAM-dependent methyltransferase|uniref:class I SAM-dependent methyltransferase n=1 Tax=Brevibacillus TaxID=55080 RepID=UPI000EE1F598|nr:MULTISPECIES: class I SAM-dependent methyltransferase [Brevibacillus]MDH6350880.1 SAM-dependent methyltransferase [Brevibacillus sp. 1238]MDR4997922.1 class I SAM-dependent methyltransferase [Brevibacillus parabrevis]NRQ53465.1 class I SAM-dependent methyltransferase [Brevibacillus sp. HD1.4A]HBZ81759.1 methyltransferase type 11 [Brevibacillus sp.]